MLGKKRRFGLPGLPEESYRAGYMCYRSSTLWSYHLDRTKVDAVPQVALNEAPPDDHRLSRTTLQQRRPLADGRQCSSRPPPESAALHVGKFVNSTYEAEAFVWRKGQASAVREFCRAPT